MNYNVIGKFELPPVYELPNYSSMAEAEESLNEQIIAWLVKNKK